MIKHLSRNEGFFFIELMIVVVIISILVIIAVPRYVKYVKRARTTEALTHVEKMCHAATDWFAHSQLGNGNFALNSDSESDVQENVKFKNVYPNVAYWWDHGDHFYSYTISTTLDTHGGYVPIVTGVAKDFNKVFASVVRSEKGCGAKVQSVSPLF